MAERLNGCGAPPRSVASTADRRLDGVRSAHSQGEDSKGDGLVREIEGLVSVERWPCSRWFMCGAVHYGEVGWGYFATRRQSPLLQAPLSTNCLYHLLTSSGATISTPQCNPSPPPHTLLPSLVTSRRSCHSPPLLSRRVAEECSPHRLCSPPCERAELFNTTGYTGPHLIAI